MAGKVSSALSFSSLSCCPNLVDAESQVTQVTSGDLTAWGRREKVVYHVAQMS